MHEGAPEIAPEESRGDVHRWFVTRQLPWLAAFCFLLLYLVTLNRWVSLQSLETISRVCGWVWKPELLRPVTFALLSPAFLLPDGVAIICMNLASAVFGAVTLALLARSVALWPRPARRMRSQHKVESLSGLAALVPPVIAVLVCGLNLSYWEHATAGTGEMLELMLLAYVIRCIVEYRRDHHDAWLYKAALVFCATMANSWLSLALLPLFLGAVASVKGMGMLNPRFAARFSAFGAAGLSFYFMWPLLQSAFSDLSFWETLKANLKFQKQMLTLLKRPAWIALTLSCIAPLIAISIRWRRPRSNASDDNPTSILFSRGLIHGAHVGLLLLGLWMALGAAFSPRHLSWTMGTALLPLHYFSCVVIGYCAGYVLLIRSMRTHEWVGKTTLISLGVVSVLMAVALLARNLPEIRKTNGPYLRQFARNAADRLAGGRSAVFSDESAPLLLLRAELAARRMTTVVPVESRLLASEKYRTFLRNSHPGLLPAAASQPGALLPGQLVDMIAAWPQTRLHYLHPSFGYYFERFRLEPRKSLYQLTSRSETQHELPESLDDGEAYWERCWAGLLNPVSDLAKTSEEFLSRDGGTWKDTLKLAPERNRDLIYLCGLYSRELNFWGVWLQRHGRWNEATKWFERALKLRPRNSIAALNLAYNRVHSGNGDPVAFDATARKLALSPAGLDTLLRDNGPADAPAVLEVTGRIFLSGGNSRQALEDFQRCLELQPDRAEALVGAAQASLTLGEPQNALTSIERALALDKGKNRRLLGVGLFYRFAALKSLGQLAAAQEALTEALGRHPDTPEVLSIAAQIHMLNGNYRDAVPLFDKLLQYAPDNPELLAGKGAAEISDRPEAAVEMFTKALALAPTNAVIRLNRAVANLKAGHLDNAEADYEAVNLASTNHPSVLFGLAEIAWRKNDRNRATALYDRYLSVGNTNSPEHQLAMDRLRQARP